jgi:hypothetical protein
MPFSLSTAKAPSLINSNRTIVTQLAQVLIRKSSKSPGSTVGVDFRVGYGTEHLEIADDAVQVAARILKAFFTFVFEISSAASRGSVFSLWTTCWEAAPPCRCVTLVVCLYYSHFAIACTHYHHVTITCRRRATSLSAWAALSRRAAVSALCQSCKASKSSVCRASSLCPLSQTQCRRRRKLKNVFEIAAGKGLGRCTPSKPKRGCNCKAEWRSFPDGH